MARTGELDSFLGRLALAAVDASVRPEDWSVICDLVTDHLGAGAFMVIAYDLQTHRAPGFYGSSIQRSQKGADLVNRFLQGEGVEDNAAYEFLARSNAGEVIGERTLLDVDENAPFPSFPWRDEVLALSGATSRSAMKLNSTGPFFDCAVSHHFGAPGEASPEMTALAPVLAPLLSKTLETCRIISALTESYALLLSLFDRLDFGAAFCDGAGRILAGNRRFSELTADRDGLKDLGGVATATLQGDVQPLRDLFGAALRPGTAPEALTMALTRRSGRLPLVVRAAPIREAQVTRGDLVLLLVIDPEEGGRLSSEGLRAFGILSPTELEICDLLVRGFGTDDISERRNTTPETTRGQIKAAVAKMACRSRLDLVRLALASAPPLKKE